MQVEIFMLQKVCWHSKMSRISTHRRLCKTMFRTLRKEGKHTVLCMQRDNIERYEHSSVDYNDPVI